MANNTVYVTAGLPVAKDGDQSPGAGENTVYVTAGLPPEVLVAGTGTGTAVGIVVTPYYYQHLLGGAA